MTIIKNLKQLTDQCITGGPLSVAPAQLDPLYVDWRSSRVAGDSAFRDRRLPELIYDSGSKLAMQLRAAQAEQRAQASQ